MSKISTWSTTAASNNSTPPDGFPEGMNPSDVNNAAREVMAAVRTQHEDAQWIDLGNTPTQTSATTFTLVGDQTAKYDVGRRVKCTDSSTLYGSITSSVFTSVTTVTVSLDSGSLSASLTAVALGIISGQNNASTSQSNVKINTQVIDIGDWNMDTTDTSAPAHSITLSKIRSVSALIRNDADNNYSNFLSVDSTETGEHSLEINASNINLRRGLGGLFDNANYTSTSYNRGWVIIQYTD